MMLVQALMIFMLVAVGPRGAIADPQKSGLILMDKGGVTDVVAGLGPFNFHFSHPTGQQEVPPPGWVLIDHDDAAMSKSLVLVWGSGGQDERIELPWQDGWALSVAEFGKIAAADSLEVTVEPRRAADPVQTTSFGRDDLRGLQALAENGKGWVPPEKAWLIEGRVEFVVDDCVRTQALVHVFERCMNERLESRRHGDDGFSIRARYVGRRPRPALYHSTVYRSENGKAGKELLQRIGDLRVAPDDQRTLDEALNELQMVTPRNTTLILFTTATDTAIGDIAALRHRLVMAGCRLYVVWIAMGDDGGARWNALEALANETGGRVVKLPARSD